MSRQQQGDVHLFQTIEDGEITVENGLVQMDGGLETAAYLSLFGGNENDDGLEGNVNNWWANFSENETSRQYRSETQFIIRENVLTSLTLLRIEQAAIRDLQWFLDEGVANEVNVTATIPKLNTLKLDIEINALGNVSNFQFVENWRASI